MGRRQTADGGRGTRALLELSPETPPFTNAPSLKELSRRGHPAGTEQETPVSLFPPPPPLVPSENTPPSADYISQNALR